MQFDIFYYLTAEPDFKKYNYFQSQKWANDNGTKFNGLD